LHRAAIESIFGLHQGAQNLSFTPCLPSHWQQAELTLKRDGRTMRFILLRVSADQALALAAPLCAPLLAQLLLPRQSLPWTTLASQTCFVIPLLREQMVATTPSSSASALRHGSD